MLNWAFVRNFCAYGPVFPHAICPPARVGLFRAGQRFPPQYEGFEPLEAVLPPLCDKFI